MDILIKVRPDGLEPNENRGDYYGDAGDRFLRTDWTMESIRRLMASANEPFHGVCLARIRTQAWDALEQLLPRSSKEREAMRTMCEYVDAYTGRFTPSLWPLLVLTTAPEQYEPALSATGASVDFVTLDEPELAEYLEEVTTSRSFGERINIGRIAQVCLGTGYSRMCLPSDGSAVIEAQFAELSNGDILLLAGYEWFNK